MQAAGEVGGIAVLVSDRFQVDEKAGCFVVAGSVAAFDLDLDLTRHILGPYSLSIGLCPVNQTG